MLIFKKQWLDLLLLPALNLVLTIIFWQSQLIHYASSTKGILLTWLTAGLFFILIQFSLQLRAERIARQELTDAEQRFSVLWGLRAQLLLFTIIAGYNTVALVQVWQLGVRPTQIFDVVVIGLLLATLLYVTLRFPGAHHSPDARLALSTGLKAAPQWVQAGAFALLGAGGMSLITLLAIGGMGILRYTSARHTAKSFAKPETRAAERGAWRDLLSIIGMGCGWLVGGL